MSEIFDHYAAEYENHCMCGLAVSGENKEYFARGRVEALRTWWSAVGRDEPQEITDLGCGIGDVSQVLAEYFPFIFPRIFAALRFTEPIFRRLPFGAQYYTIARKFIRDTER